MIIPVRNTLHEDAPVTYLNSSHASGGTSLTVKNINGFSASWAVQIGGIGQERSEIKLAGTAAPASGTVNLTAGLTYDHPTDTPVYATKYNQVIFKRSTSGTAGTATAMTGGTITITPDGTITIFDDTGGSSTYAYKASFYNSVLNTESDDSDWLTPSGFSFYSLAKMRERIKRKLFSTNFIKSDEVVDDWINEWLEKMTNTAIKVNEDYLLGTVDVAHGTAGLGTVNEGDFKEIRRIWFTTNGSDYYTATKKHVVDFLPDESFNETHPYFYMLGDNVFGKLPAGGAGTARIWYYNRPPTLDDDADEIPQSMRSYTKSFIDYALGQAYYFDSKDTLAVRFIGFAEAELKRFESEVASRSKTGPTYIRLVEGIDADDNFEFF